MSCSDKSKQNLKNHLNLEYKVRGIKKKYLKKINNINNSFFIIIIEHTFGNL